MKSKASGNSQVSFQLYGKNGAPPLILLHAFPLNSRMWKEQVPVLAESHQVISLDMRGFGESEIGDGQLLIDLFVDDVFSVMEHLNLKRASLCGLSMGGYVALRAVERHPEKVSRLILADTKSEADSNEAKIKRFDAVRKVRAGKLEEFADGFLKGAFSPLTFSGQPKIVNETKAEILQTNPLAISGALIALAARTDTSSILTKIQVPTLVMVGAEDTLTPPELSKDLHCKIGGSQLAIIPKAGHLSNLENPLEFNSSLLRFLEKTRQNLS